MTSLAGPIFDGLAGTILDDDRGDDDDDMPSDNIILRKLVVPKKVTLHNGRIFYARYERIRKSNFLPNVRVAQRRSIGPCRQRTQRGCGIIGNLLKSGLNIGSRLFKLALTQKIIEEGIKQTPNIFKAGVNKIPNKKIKKVLESELANYTVKKHKKNFITGKMLKGISNFRIENAIKKIDGEDLNNNFVGVFPADRMNKFIDFKQMIREKAGKYPFLIQKTRARKKSIGGAFSTLNQKKNSFSLTLLVLKD